MRNEINLNLEEKVYVDVIDKKEIVAFEADDLVPNCDGQPCNFSYHQDM